MNQVAESYIKEAVRTYNNDCIKATAVMVGAAAESLVLELRDAIISAVESAGETVPKKLQDWRAKTVLSAIANELEKHKPIIPTPLWEAFESHWPSFTHQIRVARNDAGHPAGIDAVSEDTVHANLLIFPELAKLTNKLTDWVKQELPAALAAPSRS